MVSRCSPFFGKNQQKNAPLFQVVRCMVDDNGLEPLTLRTSIYGSMRKRTDYIIFHIFDSFLHCLYFWMGIPCGCFNIRMA